MGYVSPEDAKRMSHAALVAEFIETQTMAAAAIATAIQFGGIEAERAIMERYERELARVGVVSATGGSAATEEVGSK